MLRKLFISSWNGKTALAVIEEGQPLELIVCTEEVPIGSIYKGIVKTIKTNIRACFVDVGLDKDVFLHEANCFDFQKLKIGDEIIVQTVKGSHHFKNAQVTMNLSLVGKYLIYFPFTNYVAASKKLSQEEREKWLHFAEENKLGDEGLILRTAVMEASFEEAKQELVELREEMKRILELGKQLGARTKLFTGMDCIEQTLNQYASFRIALIETDLEHVYNDLQKLVQTKEIFEETQVKLVNNPPINIERELELATKKVVWMKDGSYLLIEENESITSIDVNSGKSLLPAQDINIHAAKEAVRQLQLRNIGGMIVIDFIRTKDEEDRFRIQNTIEKTTKNDLNTVTIFGFTRMGLFELTRKKNRRSLLESIKQS